MIAVFTKYKEDYDMLNATPRKNFIYIRNAIDLVGITFTGIIMYYNWYENKELRDAYMYLQKRQPELFDTR
jgi:hypothetical protein